MSNQDSQAKRAAPQDADRQPEAEAAEAVDELTALRQHVDELRAQADEWLDKYRRIGADFSNYRKRQERDREQQDLEVRKRVLERFLPIAEDFRRALQHMPTDPVEAQWAQGVALIASKIDTMLGDFQVQAMEALGQPFDPSYHQALLREASSEYPAGIVMEELEKGYMIGNQVLKPALVKVSAGLEGAE